MEKSADRASGSRPGRREAARVRMLQAGLDAWVTNPPATPFESIEVRDVVAAAGRTTGAFYNLWPSVEAYRADLLTWALDPYRPRQGRVGANEAIVEVARLIEASADPLPLIRGIAQAVVGANVADQHSRSVVLVQFGALISAQGTGAEAERARQALATHYEYLSNFYDPAYAEILAAWQRRVRSPWTINSASTAMTALVDGYVMRSLFDDPSRVGPDVFADALVALITSLTTATRPTVDGDLDDFDDWSRAELGAPAMAHGELEERIARATVEVYRTTGRFEAVAVGPVAEEAGVSQRAVREVLVARWRSSTPIWQRLLLPEIEAAAARARAETTEDPLRRLASIMSVVAAVAARDPAVTNAFLHVVHSGPTEWSDADRSTRRGLTRLLIPELRDAADAGMLDRTVVATLADVEDAAELLAVNLLLRVVRSPARSSGAADYVLARLLPSFVGRPRGSL